MRDLPIGLFDSGMGGLTVMRQIAQILPNEHLIYLGDTARLPYGNKSPDAIRRFSSDNASFLLEQKIKLLIVSCHTASVHALPLLQATLPIPVIGVTQPATLSLLAATQTNCIAVLATTSTIASNVFQPLLLAQRPKLQIFPVACPLFVPLVEEGLQNHPSAYLLADHYLAPLRAHNIDAALLACTHYPLIRAPIQAALPNATLIEPARACALQAHSLLASLDLLNTTTAPRYTFFASDDPHKFQRLAPHFFQSPIDTVHLRPI
jgi:glutamate racemase